MKSLLSSAKFLICSLNMFLALEVLFRGFPQILRDTLQFSDLPLLEELFIVDPPEGELCSFPLTNLSHKLKSLSMFNTCVHFNLVTQWPQLQHLELWQTSMGYGGLSARDCLCILSCLPSLRAAGFHIAGDDEENEVGELAKVTLPSLRCLIISSFPEHDLSTLYRALDMPALEAIGFDGCMSRTFYTHLAGILRQCAMTLRLVALGQAGVIDTPLLSALAGCPSRARVVMCSSSFDGHVAARVSLARRMNGGEVYDSRWRTVAGSTHLLSLAYLSSDMWSEMLGNEDEYSFPAQTFHDIDLWDPGAAAPSELGESENYLKSVRLSICKGASVRHGRFCDSWLS
ncbi:hypothetical protein DFH11DRAFT_470253 [Phellopilus nigrolimitatus]|nr:hypothetical protein DFH11DRAFT_470253 [Phellopilus nigrolimitatus]